VGACSKDLIFLQAQKLSDREPEWRMRAAERLAAFAQSISGADAVAEHTMTLVRCCRDPDEFVRAAALGTLEVVVDGGHALRVTKSMVDIANCLPDKSSVVRSRAASLCRALSDAGFAGVVAAHINKIVRCLEVEDNAIRVTPLRALASLSSKGEASAVVEVALDTIFQRLHDKTRAVRIAACDALSCTAQAPEVQEMLLHWCNRQECCEMLLFSQPGICSVLERIKRVFMFDTDTQARLASMTTLAAFANVDGVMGALFCQRHRAEFVALARDVTGSDGHELQELVAALPGLRATEVFPNAANTREGSARTVEPLTSREGATRTEELHGYHAHRTSSSVLDAPNYCEGAHVQRDDLEDTDSDGDGHACSICQRDLSRHGAAKTLPCGHTFHMRCILRWMDRLSAFPRSCPLCRQRPGSKGLPPLCHRRPSSARH
jgi:hypothetical protein